MAPIGLTRRREPPPPLFRPAAPDPLRPDPLRREAQRRLDRTARGRVFGPLGSLLLHLLVLALILVDWHWAPPPEPEPPIPVALVLEPPPPEPPPPAPAPEPPPPRGPLASEDFGDPNPPTLGPKEVEAPKPAEIPAPQQPAPPPIETPPQQSAAVADTPAPPPPPPKPKPTPVVRQMPKPPVERPPARMAVRRAKYPGPAATRDEYLAYLVSLARQHIGLLPRALVGARTGLSVIGVTVLDDGTIARISVARSSGYADIDERVEQMILACGRFPPLPQWFQGESMQLEFRLEFPDALDE